MDKVNEETVLMYMKLLHEASNKCCRPTVVLLKMKAAAHLDIVYFILGHHKLIAMQRLVEKERKEPSTSSTLINNRRLNF